jgi:hypothetical protein
MTPAHRLQASAKNRRARSQLKSSLIRATAVALRALLALSASPSAHAWGGKIKLARTYRPGSSVVYETNLKTRATVRSNPDTLKSFLPPLPTELSAQQRNTVTIRAVHPEGTADVETRFDRFEFHSDLANRLPEKDRSAATQAEQDFSQRMTGQALTAHYDRQGQLLSFEGGEAALQQVDGPLREPLREILKLFLEQMGGAALYPDHDVKPGDQWKRKLDSPATEQFPFATEGENTLRYVGKTKYHGVKAAIVDYRFTNALKPEASSPRGASPLVPLEAMGLDLGITGDGQGRILVALDDGRVLENRSTIHQKLAAHLKGPAQGFAPKSEPLTLQVDSETTLAVDSMR